MAKVGSSDCCKCCAKCCRWIPVVFMLVIVAWSYYAYVYSLCIVCVQSVVQKVVFIIVFNIIVIMFLWSYMKAILVPPMQPPKEFLLSASDWEAMHSSDVDDSKNSYVERLIVERNLPVRTVGPNDTIRLCTICGLIKPDRAHHCSTCGVCVLQMDHHCPWTNNCVGLHNHKFFIVFLGWGTLYCLFIICTSAPYFVDFWKPGVDVSVDRFQVLFVFLAGIMFGLSQMMLGFYHLYLAGVNRTTLETYSAPNFRQTGPDPNAYNLGIKENMREMFGNNCCLAIFPIYTSRADGVQWRTRLPCRQDYHNAVEAGYPLNISSFER